MSEDIQKASRIISVVEVVGIRLVNVTAKALIRSPAEAGAVRFHIAPSAEINVPPENGQFHVMATILFQVLKEDSGERVVEIGADYELTYVVPQDVSAELKIEELSSFAGVNAVYHAWPYWREIVQTTLSRMGLPPIALPVFRVRGQRTKPRERRTAKKSKAGATS